MQILYYSRKIPRAIESFLHSPSPPSFPLLSDLKFELLRGLISGRELFLPIY
jgi:hypothetical protein